MDSLGGLKPPSCPPFMKTVLGIGGLGKKIGIGSEGAGRFRSNAGTRVPLET